MIEFDPIFVFFLIFAGSAVLATVVLALRQAVLLAYILAGVIAGPDVTGLVHDPEIVERISEFGIIFLLYLLGLNLYPQKLLKMFQEAALVTLASASIFALIGFGFAYALGYGLVASLVVGACMIFSSTILGLKLLPTTALHHQHLGEVIISVLLIQDIIAIICLIVIDAWGAGGDLGKELIWLAVALPGLGVAAFLAQRWLLNPLLARFDRVQEYIFLIAIGWCMGLAVAADLLGLSYSIGAFVAGVSLAASPIAPFISENLKPLRDFFLVVFFFSLGAALDLELLPKVLLPATLLAALALLIKPYCFNLLLKAAHEKTALCRSVGARLGQMSEFSLLLAAVALTSGMINRELAALIQVATMIGFAVSSFWIVSRMHTPIAVDESLRRD